MGDTSHPSPTVPSDADPLLIPLRTTVTTLDGNHDDDTKEEDTPVHQDPYLRGTRDLSSEPYWWCLLS